MVREEIRSIGSTPRDLRNFGLVVGGVFCLLGLLLLWRDRPFWPYPGGAGLILILLGLSAPAVLRPFQKAWMTLALLMGWVMTRLLLGLLFFLVLTPIALAARLAGHGFLDTSPAADADSYWNRRPDASRQREDYEKQF